MKPNITIIPYFIFVKVLDKKICRIFFHLHVSKSAYYNAKEFFTSKCGKINVTKKCPAFNHVHFYGFDKHLLCTTEIEPLYPPIPGYLLCYDFSKAPSFIRQSR